MRDKLKIYERLLDTWGTGDRLLDIATGHGKYAIFAHEKGYKVSAFDARHDRVPDHPGVNWSIQNLKDAEYSGYDVINCLGILYHLPVPEQVKLLKKINYATVILDTHLSEGNSDVNYFEGFGYLGMVYKEADTVAQLKGRPLASFDETEAFWHIEWSLRKLFLYCRLRIVAMEEYIPYRNFYVLKPLEEKR